MDSSKKKTPIQIVARLKEKFPSMKFVALLSISGDDEIAELIIAPAYGQTWSHHETVDVLDYVRTFLTSEGVVVHQHREDGKTNGLRLDIRQRAMITV